MRKHFFILLLYTLLAFALTWPLAMHFGTHVVGDGSDDPALTWNLWWFKHAVLNLQQSPLTSDFMFYPIGINLVFYTLTLLNDALSLPLQAVFGLVPAANILLLSSFVLSGYGAYLLVQYLLKGIGDKGQGMSELLSLVPYPFSPAFVAGLVYAFASCKLLYASLGQFNIASSQWIPFYVLYLFKVHDTLRENPNPQTTLQLPTSNFQLPTSKSPISNLLSTIRYSPRYAAIRHSLLAAVFLLLQAYAEFTFASFLIIFTFFFLLSALRPFKLFMHLTLALMFMGVVFVVGFLPILVPMVQELSVEGDFLVQGSGFAEAFSADGLGFFVPSHLHPWVGWLDGRFDFAYINFVFIGYATGALALVGAWHYRRTWLGKFWALTTLTFILIALGPAIRINGHEFAMPFMPFDLFQVLPFFKGNRYPSRYAVMIVLSVAVLVGMGMHYVQGKLGEMRGNNQGSIPSLSKDADTWVTRILRHAQDARRLISPNAKASLRCFLLCPLISILILIEHLAIPLPLSDFRVPSFYEAIRDDVGDFTVLELPLAWRNGFRVTGALEDSAGKAFMRAQYDQTVHGKRMLSGNTSRNPELKFQYFTEAPFINSLIALETGHQLDDIAIAWDKQYAREVLRFFNVRYIVLRPEAGEALRPYLESLLPELQLWREEDGIRVYRLKLAPVASNQPLRIDPTSPIARLYFAEGWGELGEQRVWAQRNETRLLLPMQQKDSELVMRLTVPDAGQQVTLLVNGQTVGAMQVMSGTHEYRWMITRQTVNESVNEIVLKWKKIYSTRTLPGAARRSEYTGFVVVKSAGNEVGDFAHIWLDGDDWSLNQRGYNLVTFDTSPRSSRPFAYSFDTFASSDESEKIAAKLEKYANFALAVRDEASLKFSPRAAGVLHVAGSNVSVGWRWSHAFVNYEPFRREPIIREDASPIRPAIVSIGERITAPQVAGAVEWIEVR